MTGLFQTGQGALNPGRGLGVPHHMRLPRNVRPFADGDAAHPRDHVVAGTRAGHVAELRPLEQGEVDPLLAVFAGMSLASRADRYLVGLPSLPRSILDALTDVDGCDHAAWLASVGGQPVGTARYLRLEPGLAELAFEVADDYQGRGLGAVLLDAITTVACGQGVRRVRATVLASNMRSRRLVGRVGIRLRPGDGMLEGEGSLRLLDPPRVDRGAVLALARTCGQRPAGVQMQDRLPSASSTTQYAGAARSLTSRPPASRTA